MKEYIFEAEKVDWLDAYHVNEVKGELIRCKDCKWYEIDEPHHCGYGGHGLRGKSDYCSDAERKEERNDAV